MKKWFKTSMCILLAVLMVVGNAAMVTAAASDTSVTLSADDDSWDIPLSDLAVSCGDYEPDGGASEGPANLAVDGNNATMWHTDWEGTTRTNHWFQFEVKGAYAVNGLRYLPRQTGNSNGTITSYEIQVSNDGASFTKVDEGTWANNSTWKLAEFDPQSVKYVRLVSVNAVTDNQWVFASAAELRLTYQPTEVSDADKTALDAKIAECTPIQQGNYTARSWQQFQKALEKATAVSANLYVSQTQVDEALAALTQAKDGLKEKVEGEGPQKILHLDSGRKYFSKDWHIALINEMAAAGYTHLQLAFGNNGMRFLLDDMTVEANNTTYNSDDIKEGIRIGNYNYGALTGYYSDDHALTEAEMDEIIAHGKQVGIEIIPHLNMPGHMSALLDAMDHIGISGSHFTGREESDSSVNLNNEAALNFMHALVEKYAAYFAAKGCKYFHIGADEYANDAYYGSMGFPSMGATLYEKFAQFVNENAAIVKRHGMTPRAWNDGIYYGSYTSEFDPDIEINYWSSGWGGYTLAKASTLDGKGHGLINTNGDYYYILGKDDRFTPGSSSTHDANLYTECAGYNLNRFMDGSTIEEPIGGMYCIWADFPGRETEQQVGAYNRLVLRAMALRMDGLDLDDMDTSVVPGGFNPDGTIAEPEEPTVPEVTDPDETDPDETDPKETYPDEEDPDETDPEDTKPDASEPDASEPDASEPDASEPDASEPDASEPDASEPDASEPEYTVPECDKDDNCVLSQFDDIVATEWYHDGIHFCVEEGIMNGMGEGKFAPTENTTRAQLVMMLYRLAGAPSIEGKTEPFSDVADTDWFYAPIVWAYENKVVNGVSETEFAPNAGVTREQVATILYRYLGEPEGTGKLEEFPDVADVSEYAVAPLTWAVGEGLITGIAQADGTALLAPTGNATRAQIATILMRHLTK